MARPGAEPGWGHRGNNLKQLVAGEKSLRRLAPAWKLRAASQPCHWATSRRTELDVVFGFFALVLA
jgi:hypothetical protein